jgi:4-hydroxy-tetrahydrodipicolinate reductase
MKTKLTIIGITGKMGKAIKDQITAFQSLEISYGISSNDDEKAFDTAIKNCDVVIDFSNVNCLEKILKYSKLYKKPLICGTTGFLENQKKLIENASKEIPILFASNFSLGMALIKRFSSDMAKHLKVDTFIDIIDSHHQFKKDAPSGSAITLKEEILKNAPDKSISMHSIRAANIIGEHRVLFTDSEEQIEIKHNVYSRNAFAKGALYCVDFIKDKNAGYFSIDDVLFKEKK